MKAGPCGVVLWLLCGAAAGCTDDRHDDIPPDPHTESLTPGGAAQIPERSARHFDPGTLAPGHTFGDLRVQQIDVTRVFEDSVWVGRVRFAGEITVSGVYQRHFDWPEPEALCFHVDGTAVAAVPAFAPDSWTSPARKVWFCFTNPDRALTLLGDADRPLSATIVVDDYEVLREFSDVFDTARLVRVESTGGPARQTLRDP